MKLILPFLVILSACSPNKQDEVQKNESNSVTSQMSLGSVDLSQPFRILGTEPFWNVDVSSDELIFNGLDRDSVRVTNPGPEFRESTAIYSGVSDKGVSMTVTLIDEECSDGMSDRTYPLSARVEIGKETFSGCAASIEFLTNSPAP